MLRELVGDRKMRPGRPNMTEAPQLSDEAWMIIQLCWEAEPTTRPTADAICNKLSIILSVYPAAIPPSPVPANALPNQRILAKSLPIKDVEPMSRPGSPAGSRPTHERRATGRVFPHFRLKVLPMAERYRTSLTLENPEHVTSTLQSSDGKVYIAGLSDGSCILWNPGMATTILEDIDEPCSDPVIAITFESSTSTYVAGFKSGRVICHHKSLSHSPSTLTLTGNDKPIICLHVLNMVVTALSTVPISQDLVIIKWCLALHRGTSSIATTLFLRGIDRSSCLCAAFSPDGKEIYIGTSSGSLFVSSTSNGQFVHRPFHLTSAVGECRSLALCPDGKKVIVSCSFGKIRLWDIKTRTYSVLRPTGAIRHSDIDSLAYSSLPVTFSPDGSYVSYASASDPRTVDIQDVSKQVVLNIDLEGAPTDGIQSLDISPNNKRLIATFHNSSRIMVYVWY